MIDALNENKTQELAVIVFEIVLLVDSCTYVLTKNSDDFCFLFNFITSNLS